MLTSRGWLWGSDREPFTTIDDCIVLARQLAKQLSQLGEQKYPLTVRRGMKQRREEVERMRDDRQSRQIKAGSRTYFIDVESTKEGGSQYLKITESRFQGEGKERERSSIMVFREHAQEFAQAISEMVAKLA